MSDTPRQDDEQVDETLTEDVDSAFGSGGDSTGTIASAGKDINDAFGGSGTATSASIPDADATDAAST